MSADNYFFLTKRGDKWVGIMRFASSDYSDEDNATERPSFERPTLEQAVAKAQREYTEYGVIVDDSCLEVPA